jgi:hypothetical protein
VNAIVHRAFEPETRNPEQGVIFLTRERKMIKALEKLAEQILSFDEASLVHLREKYRLRIEHFDGTRDWERAVIIFSIINAVSMKNNLFNEHVLKKAGGGKIKQPPTKKAPPELRRVK